MRTRVLQETLQRGREDRDGKPDIRSRTRSMEGGVHIRDVEGHPAQSRALKANCCFATRRPKAPSSSRGRCLPGSSALAPRVVHDDRPRGPDGGDALDGRRVAGGGSWGTVGGDLVRLRYPRLVADVDRAASVDVEVALLVIAQRVHVKVRDSAIAKGIAYITATATNTTRSIPGLIVPGAPRTRP